MEKATEPAPKPRVAWEYKTFYGGSRDEHDEELNKLGGEGWELVALGDDPRSLIRYVFKRQKQK